MAAWVWTLRLATEAEDLEGVKILVCIVAEGNPPNSERYRTEQMSTCISGGAYRVSESTKGRVRG